MQPPQWVEDDATPTDHPPPDADVVDALRAFVNARDWDEVRSVVERHGPALRSPRAVELLRANLGGADLDRGDETRRRLLDVQCRLLERCQQAGVDAALGGLPGVVDAVEAYLNAASPNEAKRVVLTRPELLGDDAGVVVAQVWLQQDDEGRALVAHAWARLDDVRARGADAAFAGDLDADRGVIPAHVLDELSAATTPAEVALLVRCYPLLGRVLDRLGVAAPGTEGARLREAFDDLMDGDRPAPGDPDRPSR